MFFFVGIKSLPGTFGDLSILGALKYALGVSLLWNIINTALYFLYHYIFARIFKLGKET